LKTKPGSNSQHTFMPWSAAILLHLSQTLTMRSMPLSGPMSLPVVAKKSGDSTLSTRIVLTPRSAPKAQKPRNAAMYGTGFSSMIDGPGRLKLHRSMAMPDSARPWSAISFFSAARLALVGCDTGVG
jgi:hypothetical protein